MGYRDEVPWRGSYPGEISWKPKAKKKKGHQAGKYKGERPGMPEGKMAESYIMGSTDRGKIDDLLTTDDRYGELARFMQENMEIQEDEDPLGVDAERGLKSEYKYIERHVPSLQVTAAIKRREQVEKEKREKGAWTEQDERRKQTIEKAKAAEEDRTGRTEIRTRDVSPLFKDAINLARECQPDGYNPHAPTKPIANDIFSAVAQELRLKDRTQKQRLEMLSLVDTPLDYWGENGGADGAFVLTDEDRRGGEAEHIVTVGTTMDPSKPEVETSLHVELVDLPERELNKESDYWRIIHKKALKIADGMWDQRRAARGNSRVISSRDRRAMNIGDHPTDHRDADFGDLRLPRAPRREQNRGGRGRNNRRNNKERAA